MPPCISLQGVKMEEKDKDKKEQIYALPESQDFQCHIKQKKRKKRKKNEEII